MKDTPATHRQPRTGGNPCAELDIDASAAENGRAAQVARSTEETVAAMLSAIDGLTMSAILFHHDDMGYLHGRVVFGGWSPSLHAVNVEVAMVVRKGTQADALRRLQPMLDRQAARAADAHKLGLLGPLRGNGYEVIGHLWTDRTLAALRDEDPTIVPIIRHITQAVDKIHRSAVDYAGDALLAGRAGVVAETRWGPGDAVVRMAGAAMDIMPNGRVKDQRLPEKPLPSFDGMLLTLPSRPMPETTLAVLAGRRVADLASVHPLLDDRIIHRAANSESGDRVVVALEPDLVRIQDL